MNVGSDPAAVLLIAGISDDTSDSKMGPDAPKHSGGFRNRHNAAFFKRLQRTGKICASFIPLLD